LARRKRILKRRKKSLFRKVIVIFCVFFSGLGVGFVCYNLFASSEGSLKDQRSISVSYDSIKKKLKFFDLLIKEDDTFNIKIQDIKERFVIVVNLRKKEKAISLAKEIDIYGYPNQLIEDTSSGYPIYRVYVGDFSSFKSAQETAEDLKKFKLLNKYHIVKRIEVE
jgi:hypothetical protein